MLAVLAAVTLAACAGAPPKPVPATCGRAPSSYLTNEAGVPAVAIFTCYRTDGLVSYEARQLTPAQIQEAAAALTAAQPNPSPADPCSDKNGLAYTVCRKAQHKRPKPLKAVK
jgi:hypothetical protein